MYMHWCSHLAEVRCVGAYYDGLFLSGLPHCESSVERTAKFARMMAVQSVFAAILAVNAFKETDLKHGVQYLKYTPIIGLNASRTKSIS